MSIQLLYEFFSDCSQQKIDNETIISRALAKEDPAAMKVLDFMAKNFKAEIRNVAIRYLTSGGVIIVGNFAKILGQWIQEKGLWTEDDVMDEVLKDVPVYVYSVQNHGVQGCFGYSA